jgi:hypothetical protein
MRSRKAGLRPAPSQRSATVVAPAVSPVPPPVDEPEEAAFDAAREPLEPLKSSGFQQFGTVLGGVIAGIEEQVFGRKPPGEIQVRQAQPTRGLTGEGTEVTLHFPDPEHEDEPPDRG